MSKERLEELTARYSLDLLDRSEWSELLQAARDPEVERLMREFSETASDLGLAIPQVAPPVRLKREILGELPKRTLGSTLLAFPEWLPYAIAACLMILGVAEIWRIACLERSLLEMDQTLALLQRQNTDAAEQKSMVELQLATLPAKDPAYASASVTIAWNTRLHEGVVTLQNLPPPPAGHDYQLWVLDPHASAPVSAGLIASTTPSHRFTVGRVSTSGLGFAVSLEPSGGSTLPTGPILFAVPPAE